MLHLLRAVGGAVDAATADLANNRLSGSSTLDSVGSYDLRNPFCLLNSAAPVRDATAYRSQ